MAGSMIFLNASWGITPDKKRQPKLHAFIKRMHGRDTFKKIMDPVMGLVGKLWKELD